MAKIRAFITNIEVINQQIRTLGEHTYAESSAELSLTVDPADIHLIAGKSHIIIDTEDDPDGQ